MAEERENMKLSDAASIENGKPEGKEISFLRKDDAVMETVLSKDLWACFRKPHEDTSEPEE